MTSTADDRPADATLEVLLELGVHVNGVTVAPDGRTFVVVQPESDDEPQVAEVVDGALHPYPDAAWNTADHNDHHRFIGANALRIGPDGALWVVDRGAAGIGEPQAKAGPKLVRIDLASNHVDMAIDLRPATRPWSFVDDVRIHGAHAYLTDAGAPAIVVIDLRTGECRRLLEGHPSTVAQDPLVAEGRTLRDPDGRPVVIHNDQLEISSDGRWFLYQPCSGRLSRVPVHTLEDTSLSERAVADAVEAVADTPPTGGTAMGADGTLYLSDVDRRRLLTVSPDGQVETLLDDPRLAWVDAMWITDDGDLLLPAAQLNRTAGLNAGEDVTEPPITIYRLRVGQPGFRA